jgi:hypothetical protein
MSLQTVRPGKTPGTSGRRSVAYRSLTGRTYEGKILGASTVVNVTTLTRATNVVNAVVAPGHGLTLGKRVTVDGATNNTFDGTFIVTFVNSTNVQWAQVAADEPAGGAGTIQVTGGRRVELVSQRGGTRAARIRDHVGPGLTMKSVDSYFYSYSPNQGSA